MRMRPGLAAVERGDLVGLDGARRQHGVGALDDGRLGLGPAVGHVGLDLFGHRLGLDPVEGVERADQRQVQLVLDHVARQPGQPVVGVDRRVGQASPSVPPDPAAAAMRPSTPAVNSSTTAGRDSLGTHSSGPAGTWCTRRPGSTSTTGGRSGDQARVNTSQAHAGAGQGRASAPGRRRSCHRRRPCRAGPGGTCAGREPRAGAWRADPTGGRPIAPATWSDAGAPGPRSGGGGVRRGRWRTHPAAGWPRPVRRRSACGAGARRGVGARRSSSCSRRNER